MLQSPASAISRKRLNPWPQRWRYRHAASTANAPSAREGSLGGDFVAVAHPAPENPAAYFLALRYAVRTEEYDRTLPHRLVLGIAEVRPDYRHLSQANARRERDALQQLNAAVGVDAAQARRAGEWAAKLSFDAQREQLQWMPAELRQLCADL